MVIAEMHSAPSCNGHSWPMILDWNGECASSAGSGALSSAVCVLGIGEACGRWAAAAIVALPVMAGGSQTLCRQTRSWRCSNDCGCSCWRSASGEGGAEVLITPQHLLCLRRSCSEAGGHGRPRLRLCSAVEAVEVWQQRPQALGCRLLHARPLQCERLKVLHSSSGALIIAALLRAEHTGTQEGCLPCVYILTRVYTLKGLDEGSAPRTAASSMSSQR